MDEGFIKLNRKFFKNKYWTKARTFSECEAWIDLIQSARFDATPLTESIGGRNITYGRGQYPASIRFLSKRWNWGEQKVRSFLNELKKDKSITTDDSQGMNIITLCKYETYNNSKYVLNTADNTVNNTDIELLIKELRYLKTQVITQQITQGQHSDNTKNKKDKKERINTPPIIPLNGDSDLSFEKVWKMYEKKGNRKTSEKKWSVLENHCKELAIKHIPLYIHSTPDKRYRKNFETYINQEVWNDEIITYSKQNEEKRGNDFSGLNIIR